MTKTWLNRNVVLFDPLMPKTQSLLQNILHSVIIHTWIPNTDQIIYFSPSIWRHSFYCQTLHDSHFNYFSFSLIHSQKGKGIFLLLFLKRQNKIIYHSRYSDDVIFTSGGQYKHFHYSGFEILNTETAMIFLSSYIFVQ